MILSSPAPRVEAWAATRHPAPEAVEVELAAGLEQVLLAKRKNHAEPRSLSYLCIHLAYYIYLYAHIPPAGSAMSASVSQNHAPIKL